MPKRGTLKLAIAAATIASAISLTGLGSQALGVTAAPHAPAVSHSKTVRMDETVTTRAVPTETGGSGRPTWCWDTSESSTCCPYLYLCAWRGEDGSGTRVEAYYCDGDVPLPDFIGDGSWINNESAGTHAYFLNESGTIIYTTPAPTAGTPTWNDSYDWTPVWYLEACS
jgi:hypothetical protein